MMKPVKPSTTSNQTSENLHKPSSVSTRHSSHSHSSSSRSSHHAGASSSTLSSSSSSGARRSDHHRHSSSKGSHSARSSSSSHSNNHSSSHSRHSSSSSSSKRESRHHSQSHHHRDHRDRDRHHHDKHESSSKSSSVSSKNVSESSKTASLSHKSVSESSKSALVSSKTSVSSKTGSVSHKSVLESSKSSSVNSKSSSANPKGSDIVKSTSSSTKSALVSSKSFSEALKSSSGSSKNSLLSTKSVTESSKNVPVSSKTVPAVISKSDPVSSNSFSDTLKSSPASSKTYPVSADGLSDTLKSSSANSTNSSSSKSVSVSLRSVSVSIQSVTEILKSSSVSTKTSQVDTKSFSEILKSCSVSTRSSPGGLKIVTASSKNSPVVSDVTKPRVAATCDSKPSSNISSASHHHRSEPSKFSFNFKDTDTYKRIAMATSVSGSAQQSSTTSSSSNKINKVDEKGSSSSLFAIPSSQSSYQKSQTSMSASSSHPSRQISLHPLLSQSSNIQTHDLSMCQPRSHDMPPILVKQSVQPQRHPQKPNPPQRHPQKPYPPQRHPQKPIPAQRHSQRPPQIQRLLHKAQQIQRHSQKPNQPKRPSEKQQLQIPGIKPIGSKSSNVRSSHSNHKRESSSAAVTDKAIKHKHSLKCLRKKMPNLLGSVKQKHSNDNKANTSTSSKITHPPVKHISRSLVHSPSKPVSSKSQNIFLQKYDPIKLLSRLKASDRTQSSSKSKAKRRKVLVCDVHAVHTANNNLNGGHLPPPKLKLKENATTRKLRRERRLKKLKERQAKLMPSSNSKSDETNGPEAGFIMIKKQSPVPKCRSIYQKKLIKYAAPPRRLITEDKLRVLAALYLKRALHRRRKPKKAVKTKPKKKCKKKMAQRKARKALVVANSPNPNQIPFKITVPPPRVIRQTQISLPNSPMMMFSIDLLRYKREVQDKLEALNSEGVIYRLSRFPKLATKNPAEPSLTYNTIKLKDHEVKEILSDRLMLLITRGGFTHANVRPIEVLSNFLANFFTQMATRLKDVTETNMLGACHGFPDPMERVLNEFGLGGIKGLEQYYKTDIIDYNRRMEEQCRLLRRQFAYKVRSKVYAASDKTSTPNTPSSSVPLSPGNSVLAEILSTQEENQSKLFPESRQKILIDLTTDQPQTHVMEKTAEEELMGSPPPNVVIRRDSSYSLPLTPSPQQKQQQLPAPHSIISLSTGTGQSFVRSSAPTSLTQLLQRPVNYGQHEKKYVESAPYLARQQQQPQSAQIQLVPSPSTPIPSPQYDNLNFKKQKLKELQQELADLIRDSPFPLPPPIITPQRREFFSKPSSVNELGMYEANGKKCFDKNKYLYDLKLREIVKLEAGSQQGIPPSPGTPLPSPSLSMGSPPSPQIITIPMHTGNEIGLAPPTPPATKVNPNQINSTSGASPVTIRRAGIVSYTPNVNYQRQGLHQVRQINSSTFQTTNNSGPSVTQHHTSQQHNNVIRINLGRITNGSGTPLGSNNVTLSAPPQSSIPSPQTTAASPQGNFPPTIQLRESGNTQRNLIRLNFEQAPGSGADSTVLLSSSSPANQTDPNTDQGFIPIQFF